MKRIRIGIIMSLLVSSSAFAMTPPDLPVPSDGLPAEVEMDPISAVFMLFEHLAAGQGVLGAAVLLALLAAVLLRVGRRIPWAATKRGRAIVVALMGLCSSLSMTLSAGTVPSIAMLVGAMAITYTAIGARGWIKSVLWPEDGAPWLPWLRDLLGAGVKILPPPPPPPPPPPTVLADIAKACHEVNRAYCIAMGDHSQPEWDVASQEHRGSLLRGVAGALAGNTPQQSHESWLAEKRRAGWSYGPKKDPVAKTHPCMVPYGKLPFEQQVKDTLFVSTARAMAAKYARAGGKE